MGLSAHALDELAGRPLNTRIPDLTLRLIAVGGLGGAVALGIAGSIVVTPWLLVFVVFGLFIAPAYNLEWFGGRFHSDFWFAFAWGSFPFLTAYWVSGERLELPAVFGAIARLRTEPGAARAQPSRAGRATPGARDRRARSSTRPERSRRSTARGPSSHWSGR